MFMMICVSETLFMPKTAQYLHHDLLKQIASKVKSERQKMGISQEELAFIANVHRTYIGMIKRAEQNVTIMTVKKICDALGISLSEFFIEFRDAKPERVSLMKKVRGKL
jgi:transcriptional regulator with XRE-family HTH domain